MTIQYWKRHGMIGKNGRNIDNKKRRRSDEVEPSVKQSGVYEGPSSVQPVDCSDFERGDTSSRPWLRLEKQQLAASSVSHRMMGWNIRTPVRPFENLLLDASPWRADSFVLDNPHSITLVDPIPEHWTFFNCYVSPTKLGDQAWVHYSSYWQTRAE